MTGMQLSNFLKCLWLCIKQRWFIVCVNICIYIFFSFVSHWEDASWEYEASPFLGRRSGKVDILILNLELSWGNISFPLLLGNDTNYLRTRIISLSLSLCQQIIRPLTNPIKETGHIQILYGNLAPDGSVAKITGKEGLYFSGAVFYYISMSFLFVVVML